MVTFETKVYENDWFFLLAGNYIDRMILGCNYDFKKRVLYINNVRDKDKVKRYAEKKIEDGILDCYHVVDDYADEALAFFDLTRESFRGGYYYSISELVGIYLCDTEYLFHLSGDSYIEDGEPPWIDEAIDILKKRKDIIVANPTWNRKSEEAKKESTEEIGGFYFGRGFSDQCYLIKTDVFRGRIYNEKHIESERFPKYGGELFEKRVDSYMRNHDLFRITSKEANYIHKNFPKNIFLKKLYGGISRFSNNGALIKLFR